jgi:hypothetical protein
MNEAGWKPVAVQVPQLHRHFNTERECFLDSLYNDKGYGSGGRQ